jgi:hypothetical protein
MRRRTTEEWNGIMLEFERSGLSQVTFAERHGFSVATLRYQVARRRERADEQMPGFVEVRTSEGSELNSVVEVNIGEHIRVRGTQWPEVSWLVTLAQTMGRR